MENFSVLMSLYYKESPKYLDISLNSIYNQTAQPDQVVLVLDGPIGDDLQKVVNKYFNEFNALEVYPQDKNQGLSTALNIGLGKCRNEIVFRMDTDDVCYPNRFEEMLRLYEQDPKLELAGSFATMIDEEGNELKEMFAPVTEDDIKKKVWTCPFIHPTVSFKKKSILGVGGYNPNAGPRQDDYELWFRCIVGGIHCMNYDKPLLYYRFSTDSISKNNVKVGWWRFKVGIKGAIACKCSLIAYIGVAYPLFRSLMPKKVEGFMYDVFGKINPRTKKYT